MGSLTPGPGTEPKLPALEAKDLAFLLDHQQSPPDLFFKRDEDGKLGFEGGGRYLRSFAPPQIKKDTDLFA